MIYGDVNICHAVVDENGYIKYIGTRCHERRKGYATNLINELKLEFESLTCKTNKNNKVATKSKVTASATGTSTNTINYLTIDNT